MKDLWREKERDSIAAQEQQKLASIDQLEITGLIKGFVIADLISNPEQFQPPEWLLKLQKKPQPAPNPLHVGSLPLEILLPWVIPSLNLNSYECRELFNLGNPQTRQRRLTNQIFNLGLV